MLSRTLVALILLAAPLAVSGQGGQPKPKPKPSPTPAPKTPSTKPAGQAPRVFTNDDLEAGKDKPSPVQDLKAHGGSDYEPPAPAAATPAPLPEETPEPDPEVQKLAELEARIKSLDDSAKALLWQYLQSNDTNEILQLKAEQKEVLNQLEEARAELVRLKAAGPATAPQATPTPPPG